MTTLLNETRERLAEVQHDQQETDVMGVWYALQELVDYYEGLIEELTEQETGQ